MVFFTVDGYPQTGGGAKLLPCRGREEDEGGRGSEDGSPGGG